MRLTDAVFARMVVDIRSLLDAMPSELKADIDGDFLTAIAEQPIEILKCAMYLFLGYLDGTSQFAQACGGGGISSDLPWGRNQDEDDCRFAYRCMMQTHKMLKPFQPKRRIDDMNFMCFTMSQNWAYLYKITEGKKINMEFKRNNQLYKNIYNPIYKRFIAASQILIDFLKYPFGDYFCYLF